MSYHKSFNTDFVHETDSGRALEKLRSQITSSRGPRGAGRHRGGPSRATHQNRRSDNYRRGANDATSSALHAALNRKLFPGIMDGQSAAERLEAYNAERATTIPVTT